MKATLFAAKVVTFYITLQLNGFLDELNEMNEYKNFYVYLPFGIR